ncbi:MAG: hypothetical protein U5M23_10240 [Marinagarivorans sp.]|nr:hypothetical protein [Marinagarivorans sp.]
MITDSPHPMPLIQAPFLQRFFYRYLGDLSGGWLAASLLVAFLVLLPVLSIARPAKARASCGCTCAPMCLRRR